MAHLLLRKGMTMLQMITMGKFSLEVRYDAAPDTLYLSTGHPSLEARPRTLSAGVQIVEDPANHEAVDLIIEKYETDFRRSDFGWLIKQHLPANAMRFIMARPKFRGSKRGVSADQLIDIARYSCSA